MNLWTESKNSARAWHQDLYVDIYEDAVGVKCCHCMYLCIWSYSLKTLLHIYYNAVLCLLDDNVSFSYRQTLSTFLLWANIIQVLINIHQLPFMLMVFGLNSGSYYLFIVFYCLYLGVRYLDFSFDIDITFSTYQIMV